MGKRGGRKRRASSDSEDDEEDAQPDSKTGRAIPVSGGDLDAEREECMRRNQQRLIELGLLPAVASLKQAVAGDKKKPVTRKPKADKENAGEGEQPALRRSLRAKGVEPELPVQLEVLFRSRNNNGEDRPYDAPVRPPRPRSIPAAGADATKFDAHNLHRLRTMSDEAMLKRIHKISNTLKLMSLVQLLKDFGRHELAEEAQAALDERLACV
ncbi:hypothetical protein HYH03_007863 [Edaphochlamys debaryana]|uniref:Uncharacterized protein n=1 Tax=Edaphochlamys debaryana TaxID=47281 RepID=A0A836BZG9_9CHLO|nr:hypothetical protein HYH03_007863 [Edaphochlamys debaryana]|eukprot:KAG2493932.1 hypothetical protein HYH03_007863 [Edaphochlamys debaryana]